MTGREAKRVSMVLARVLDAVQSGARSAREYRPEQEAPALTYADGWHAASTLVALSAADAMAQTISEDHARDID